MAPLTKIVALFDKNCRGAFLALFGEKVAHLNSKQLDTLLAFDLKSNRGKMIGNSDQDRPKSDLRSDHIMIGNLEQKVIADQIKSDRPITI